MLDQMGRTVRGKKVLISVWQTTANPYWSQRIDHHAVTNEHVIRSCPLAMPTSCVARENAGRVCVLHTIDANSCDLDSKLLFLSWSR